MTPQNKLDGIELLVVVAGGAVDVVSDVDELVAVVDGGRMDDIVVKVIGVVVAVLEDKEELLVPNVVVMLVE